MKFKIPIQILTDVKTTQNSFFLIFLPWCNIAHYLLLPRFNYMPFFKSRDFPEIRKLFEFFYCILMHLLQLSSNSFVLINLTLSKWNSNILYSLDSLCPILLNICILHLIFISCILLIVSFFNNANLSGIKPIRILLLIDLCGYVKVAKIIKDSKNGPKDNGYLKILNFCFTFKQH